MTNNSDHRIDVSAGERIAQLTLERNNDDVQVRVLKRNKRLYDAAVCLSRRKGGFGSTGK